MLNDNLNKHWQGYVSSHQETVDVEFSLDTSAYASGDVLAECQPVQCMRKSVQTGVLSGLVLIDEDDQGVEMDVVFFSEKTALGGENAAVAVTDAAARSFLGRVNVAAADWLDLGGCKVATKLNINLPIKPGNGTDTIYIGLITRGTPTHTASGLRGRFTFFQN